MTLVNNCSTTAVHRQSTLKHLRHSRRRRQIHQRRYHPKRQNPSHHHHAVSHPASSLTTNIPRYHPVPPFPPTVLTVNKLSGKGMVSPTPSVSTLYRQNHPLRAVKINNENFNFIDVEYNSDVTINPAVVNVNVGGSFPYSPFANLNGNITRFISGIPTNSNRLHPFYLHASP